MTALPRADIPLSATQSSRPAVRAVASPEPDRFHRIEEGPRALRSISPGAIHRRIMLRGGSRVAAQSLTRDSEGSSPMFPMDTVGRVPRPAAAGIALAFLTAVVPAVLPTPGRAEPGSLEGSWSGGGAVRLPNGAQERARCWARYSRASRVV